MYASCASSFFWSKQLQSCDANINEKIARSVLEWRQHSVAIFSSFQDYLLETHASGSFGRIPDYTIPSNAWSPSATLVAPMCSNLWLTMITRLFPDISPDYLNERFKSASASGCLPGSITSKNYKLGFRLTWTSKENLNKRGSHTAIFFVKGKQQGRNDWSNIEVNFKDTHFWKNWISR